MARLQEVKMRKDRKSTGELRNALVSWTEKRKYLKTGYHGMGDMSIFALVPIMAWLSKITHYKIYRWKPVAFVPDFDEIDIRIHFYHAQLENFLSEFQFSEKNRKIKIKRKS